MADISDITSYLRTTVTGIVYPSGTGSPSIAAQDVRIFEGWPLPDQLELDMAGKMLTGTPPKVVVRPGGQLSNISIFPMLGTNATPYQIQDKTFVVSQPVYGLTPTLAGNVISVAGNPNPGEYLTIIADRKFAYSATGSTTAAIVASLAASLAANYPGVSHTGATLTVPFQYALTIRQGGQGVLGKASHRQTQSVMVTVWSPTHDIRTALAKPIDTALKKVIIATMPDTSQAKFCYNRTNVIDDQQTAGIYRRDLVYDVEFATVEEFPGFVITTVNTSVANYNNSSVVPAIT